MRCLNCPEGKVVNTTGLSDKAHNVLYQTTRYINSGRVQGFAMLFLGARYVASQQFQRRKPSFAEDLNQFETSRSQVRVLW